LSRFDRRKGGKTKRIRILPADALVSEPDLYRGNVESALSESGKEREETYKFLMLCSAKEKIESVFTAGRAALSRLHSTDGTESFDGWCHGRYDGGAKGGGGKRVGERRFGRWRRRTRCRHVGRCRGLL
jgi:hypothetical protein